MGPRRLCAFAATALGLALVPWAARGDDGAVDVVPLVDLAERVPARWVSAEADELRLQSERWIRTLPARCHTRGGYRRWCQGERRVPTPHGPDAILAVRLALGQRATALQLQHGPAFPEWLAAVQGADADPLLHWPVPSGRLGREFGRVREGALRSRRHFGIDIGAEEGAPIEAARGGLVVFSDDGLTGYGNALMILHEDDTTTFYAHCRATLVFAGQRVARGQPVAEVGQTGFAPAPHLHFEWRERGWARDPLGQMAEHARRYGHEAQ